MVEWQSGLSSYGILRRSPLQDVVMISVHIEGIFMYNVRQPRVPYELTAFSSSAILRKVISLHTVGMQSMLLIKLT